MAQGQPSSAVRALQLELKKLSDEPVEGFQVLANDENIFEWQVAIFGPPGTLYEGGYFKAQMKFPSDYPYSPPAVRFLTKMWHPNVYENGEVCISILHPPVDDPQSGELPSERWNPTQNVRTILLSIISLLNEPNTFSPANVDASVAYRKWRDSKGKESNYANIIRKQVLATQEDAAKDGVVVPVTLQEYCLKSNSSVKSSGSPLSGVTDDANFYVDDDDDDYVDDDDDIEEEDDENGQSCLHGDCEGDSGHGDS